MKKIAHVRPQILSDKSNAYNVVIPADASVDIRPDLIIGAIDESHAHAIADALNAGVAWIE